MKHQIQIHFDATGHYDYIITLKESATILDYLNNLHNSLTSRDYMVVDEANPTLINCHKVYAIVSKPTDEMQTVPAPQDDTCQGACSPNNV